MHVPGMSLHLCITGCNCVSAGLQTNYTCASCVSLHAPWGLHNPATCAWLASPMPMATPHLNMMCMGDTGVSKSVHEDPRAQAYAWGLCVHVSMHGACVCSQPALGEGLAEPPSWGQHVWAGASTT